MRSYTRFFTLLLVCLLMVPGAVAAGDLRISQAYARETPPGASSAALYLIIHNEAENRRVLIAGVSNRSKRVMIHQNQLQGDMMRMRHLAELEIAGNSQVEFKPGGLHLMLSGLSGGLRAGEVLILRLLFKDGQELTVDVPVLAISAQITTRKEIGVHHE